MSRLCGVEVDEVGTTVTVCVDDGCGVPELFHHAIDPKKLCNLPAAHENPQYLTEDGIYNYVHWLCDAHWDRFLEIKLEEA